MKKLTVLLVALMSVFAINLSSAFAKDASKSTSTTEVKGYTKKDGTVVKGYTRTKKTATAEDTQQVTGYTKKDGTKVAGYTRKKATKSSK